MERLTHLDANTTGRDIVVGDLHGQRTRLEGELERIAFDPRADRLICVGDLVDRGPESAHTAALMDEPWFHAVRGNHDLSVLAAFDAGHDPDTAGSRRFDLICDDHAWMNALDTATADATLARLRRMPYALEVATASGSVGIVHAEVPDRFASWQAFIAEITSEANGAGARYAACWERNLAHRAAPCERVGRPEQANALAGIDHVIHGHTPMAQPPEGTFIGRMGNRYWIDTIGWIPEALGTDWARPPHFTLVAIDSPWQPL